MEISMQSDQDNQEAVINAYERMRHISTESNYLLQAEFMVIMLDADRRFAKL